MRGQAQFGEVMVEAELDVLRKRIANGEEFFTIYPHEAIYGARDQLHGLAEELELGAVMISGRASSPADKYMDPGPPPLYFEIYDGKSKHTAIKMMQNIITGFYLNDYDVDESSISLNGEIHKIAPTIHMIGGIPAITCRHLSENCEINRR